MKYEVILTLKELVIVDWKFKSINQVCKFLDECCLGVLTAHVYRVRDGYEFDVDQLLEVYYG